MIADLIAEDAAGHYVLFVVARSRTLGDSLIAEYIRWIHEGCPTIPFGMIVQKDQIHVIKYGTDDENTVACRLDTEAMLRPYDAEFGTKRISSSYLATLVDAWLRDLASHWKTEDPPGSDALAKAGLLQLLKGGTTRREVVLDADPVR